MPFVLCIVILSSELQSGNKIGLSIHTFTVTEKIFLNKMLPIEESVRLLDFQSELGFFLKKFFINVLAMNVV